MRSMAGEEQQRSQDFHNILGISKGANLREIGKAYRSLVMKWHPDKHQNSSKKEAEDKFVAITQAYKVSIDHACCVSICM